MMARLRTSSWRQASRSPLCGGAYNLTNDATLPLDFASVDAPRVFGNLLSPLHDGTTEPTPEAFVRNCVLHDRTSAFDGETGNTVEICRPLYIRGPRIPLWVQKSRVGSGIVIADDQIDFSLTFGAQVNFDLDPNRDLPLVDPIFYDLLPSGLSYTPASWSVTQNNSGIPDQDIPPPVVVSTDWFGDNSNRTLLRWDFAGLSFQPGEIIIGTITTEPKSASFPDGTPVTTLSNEFSGKPGADAVFYCRGATDTGPETGSVDDEDDLDGDSDREDQICTASASVDVRAPRLTIEAIKTNLTGQVFHGSVVDIGLSVRPTGTTGKDLDLINPTVVDLLPFGLEYVEGSATVVAGATTTPVFDQSIDEDTGRTQLRWRFTGETFSVGADPVVILYQVSVPLGAFAGTYVNNLYVLPENNQPEPESSIFFCGSDSLYSPDSSRVADDLDGDKTVEPTISPAQPKPAATAQLISEKLVRGQLDQPSSASTPTPASPSPAATSTTASASPTAATSS
jgi:hypothetical protein